MNKEKVLDHIFNNDPLGLLNIKAKYSNVCTADERLRTSFQEIIDFIESNGKLPEKNINNMSEFQLYSRLKSLKKDKSKIDILKQYDVHHLLP